MRGQLRVLLGILSTLLFVGIGATLFVEGARWVGALLLALGVMRAIFVIRDARAPVSDEGITDSEGP